MDCPALKFMAVKGSSVIYSAGLAPRLWSPETQPAGWGCRIAQGLGCQEKASGSWVIPHNSMIDIFLHKTCPRVFPGAWSGTAWVLFVMETQVRPLNLFVRAQAPSIINSAAPY